MTLGIVLSGGGARGAYEAGVLSHAFGSIGRTPPAVIAGTSVGAFNGAFLAATFDDVARGMNHFVDRWQSIELSDVFRFGLRQAFDLHRVVFGGRGEVGIFDVAPLRSLLASGVPWPAVARNVGRGSVRALSISATHVRTGRTVVFAQSRHEPETRALAANISIVRRQIHPEHVLASTAIPVLFPPVQIEGELYFEGGLRLNTPMAPAIHFGADRLLVTANSPPAQEAPFARPDRTPGLSFLLGKVLNAFLLDHVTTDLLHLERINALLQEGIDRYGPDFLPGRRIIRTLVVRPSEDIGRLAQQHLARNRLRFDRIFGRSLLELLDVGEGLDADLASYLLFDGAFVRELIAMGRRDAAQRKEEIADFLRSEMAANAA
jgi:NTE family protein